MFGIESSNERIVNQADIFEHFGIMLKTQSEAVLTAEFNKNLNDFSQFSLFWVISFKMIITNLSSNVKDLSAKNKVKAIEAKLIKILIKSLCNLIIINNYNDKHTTWARKASDEKT